MNKVNLGTKPLSKLKKFMLWLFWITHPKADRRPWEEVKHGNIEHTCQFSDVEKDYEGIKYKECIHYGCKTVHITHFL